jgi:ubiquinone/menaquinone biosynthesis C-methylase UbiE
MPEEFWWQHAGCFYSSARMSKFVQNVHRAFFEQVDRLPLPPKPKSFDAGCGDGNSTFPQLIRGFEVTAVDFGNSVLQQAMKRQKRLGLSGVTFEVANLNHPLKYEDASFDLVTSLHVIMKVRNYKSALREFYRIVKPGGYAVISTTSSSEEFSSWFMRYVKRHGLIKGFWDVRWLVAWGVPYVLMTKKADRRNEWRWTTEDLSRHMEEAGFTTLHTEDVPYTHVGCALGVFTK